MPTFRHGKNTFFAIGDAVGGFATVNVVSNVLRNVSLPRDSDTADTTAFTSTQKTYVVGIPGGKMSMDGPYDAAADLIFSGLVGFETPMGWKWGPEGGTSTRVSYGQPGGVGAAGFLLSNYDIMSPVGDLVSVKLDGVASGAITRTASATFPGTYP